MAYEFNQGERALQDRFDTRRLADRVAQLTSDTIGDGDRDFIERMDMFFLATVDANGNVDCGYKGGEPGFVRVIDERTIAFPWYDGNGQYMGAGNIMTMGKVAMLFIDFEHARRMRVNGTATIDFGDPLAQEFHEAQFVVRVHTEEVFPNCPRYIHKMQLVERSQFVPHVECETPDPDWKDHFEEDLPERDQQRRAAKRVGAPAGSDR